MSTPDLTLVRTAVQYKLEPSFRKQLETRVMFHQVALSFVALSAMAAGTLADPLACQPNAQQPMLPIFHIIGNVSVNAAGNVSKLEPINDCSGVTYYGGLYHIWHQCCQNHWDHVISKVHPERHTLYTRKIISSFSTQASLLTARLDAPHPFPACLQDLIHWQRLPPPIQPVTTKTWDGSISMLDGE